MARRPSAWVCRGALISAHRGARRGAPASAGPLCSRGLWSQLARLLSLSLSPPPPLTACPPSPASWSAVEQSLVKLGENLNSLSNSQLRSRADDCISLIKR